MTLDPLSLLTRRAAPGVWRAELEADDRARLVEGGAQVLEVDLRTVSDEATLFDCLADVLGLPDTPGGGREAIHEALGRRAAQGDVVVLTVRDPPGDSLSGPSRILATVLQEAARLLLERRQAFLYVLWPTHGGAPDPTPWPYEGQP